MFQRSFKCIPPSVVSLVRQRRQISRQSTYSSPSPINNECRVIIFIPIPFIHLNPRLGGWWRCCASSQKHTWLNASIGINHQSSSGKNLYSSRPTALCYAIRSEDHLLLLLTDLWSFIPLWTSQIFSSVIIIIIIVITIIKDIVQCPPNGVATGNSQPPTHNKSNPLRYTAGQQTGGYTCLDVVHGGANHSPQTATQSQSIAPVQAATRDNNLCGIMIVVRKRNFN